MFILFLIAVPSPLWHVGSHTLQAAPANTLGSLGHPKMRGPPLCPGLCKAEWMDLLSPGTRMAKSRLERQQLGGCGAKEVGLRKSGNADV